MRGGKGAVAAGLLPRCSDRSGWNALPDCRAAMPRCATARAVPPEHLLLRRHARAARHVTPWRALLSVSGRREAQLEEVSGTQLPASDPRSNLAATRDASVAGVACCYVAAAARAARRAAIACGAPELAPQLCYGIAAAWSSPLAVQRMRGDDGAVTAGLVPG